MLLSGLFAAKARGAKNAENKKRAAIQEAKRKIANGTATKEDEITARRLVIPTSGFWRVFSGFFGFIESIPVTGLVIKIIAILLIVTFIVLMIQWIMTAIATSMVGIVSDAATAMNFKNPYLMSLDLSTELDEDGSFRKRIRYGTGEGVVPIVDPSDPSIIIPIFNEISDVEFWCNLSDDNIQRILDAWVDSGDLFYTGSAVTKNSAYYVFLANMFRFIRMAYRVCYAQDADGQRIFKTIEPATLIGMMLQEKGYDWMRPDSFSVDGKYGLWVYTARDGSTFKYNILSNSTYSYADSFLYYSVDNWTSGRFSPLYSGAAYLDGPYSLTSIYLNESNHMFETSFLASYGPSGEYRGVYDFLMNNYGDTYTAFNYFLVGILLYIIQWK